MPKLHDARNQILLSGFGRSCPRCKAVHGNRWTIWASTLYARHARMAARWRGLALVLARNQLINLRVNRWYRSSKFFSQLRLSIGPFFLPSPSDGSNESAVRSTQQDFVPRRDFRAQLTAFPNQSRAVQHSRPAGSSNVGIKESRDLAALSPLELVGTRLTESIHKQRSIRFETRSMAQQLHLVNRVIDERRRVEVLTRRNLTNRDRWESAKDATVRREPTIIESEHTAQSGSSQPNRMAEGWPIDLQRLTDQVVQTIDSRILAHRERTGNVF